MEYERRCSIAVIVAVAVAALSALPSLQVAASVAFVSLFLFAFGLVVRFTAAEDGTPLLTRRSARAWLACTVLGAAVFVSSPPGSMAVLMLRCLGAVTLVEALAFGSRRHRGMASSTERPSS